MDSPTPMDPMDLSSIDPWDWTIDQVIVAICDPRRTFMASKDPRSLPDPTLLEKAIRDHAINGRTLLKELNNDTLYHQLGIKKLGHCSEMMQLIKRLRNQSDKFLKDVEVPDFEFSYPSNFRLRTQPSIPRPSPSIAKYEEKAAQTVPQAILGNLFSRMRQASSSTKSSIIESSLPEHKTSLSPDISQAGTAPSTDLSAVRISTLQEKDHGVKMLDFTSHEKASDSAITMGQAFDPSSPLKSTVAETSSSSEDQSQTIIPDVIASLSLEEPIDDHETSICPINTDINLPSPTNVNDLSTKGNPIIDASKSPALSHTENMESPRSDSKMAYLSESIENAGTVFIDENGRKRVKPVLVVSETKRDEYEEKDQLAVNTEESPESEPFLPPELLQSPTNLLQSMSERKPNQSYLGTSSFSVDQIFYGETPLNHEVNHEMSKENSWQLISATNSNEFKLLNTPFSNGQRLYVYDRVRHYLFSERCRAFIVKQRAFRIPYSDKLGRKNQPLSITMFSDASGKIIASRKDRMKIPVATLHPQDFRSLEISGLPLRQNEEDETHWDYLNKWNHRYDNGQTWSTYGDSESDRDDLEMSQKSREERRKLGGRKNHAKVKKLSPSTVDAIIEMQKEQMLKQWALVQEPRLLRKALWFWKISRKKKNLHARVDSFTTEAEYLEWRLANIVRKIQAAEWSSALQVKRQCKSMEQTIYRRKELMWKIEILQLPNAPEQKPSVSTKSRVPNEKNILPHAKKDEHTNDEDSISDLNDFIDDESISGVSNNKVDDEVPNHIDDETDGSFASFRSCRSKSISRGFSNTNGTDTEVKHEPSHDLISIRRRPFTTPSQKAQNTEQLNIIDLTQMSDSNEADDPHEANDSLKQSLTEPPRFKMPPMASAIGNLDSKSSESRIWSMSILPDLRDVKKIQQLDVDLLIERNDRIRLLIWIISHVSHSRREKVLAAIRDETVEELQSDIWAGLKALKSSSLRIRGIKKHESDVLMLLASWFVCWTVPVKPSPKSGIISAHISFAISQKREFYHFYKALEESLDYYDSNFALSDEIVTDMKLKKKRKIRDDFDDHESSLQSTRWKKRKYVVPESQEALDIRSNAHQRVRERDLRQAQLKDRFRAMGVNEDDSSKVVVNTGKLDDQDFIYLNPTIGNRIQRHQQEGLQFMWREVVAGGQGCLLAQTMGLGKTMQIIALLVTIAEAAKSPNENVRDQIPKGLHDSRTIILCPPALIENWWDELLLWTPMPTTNNIGEIRKVTTELKLTERIWEIETWRDQGGVLLLGFVMFRELVQNKVKKLNDEQHGVVLDALLNAPGIIVADEAHFMKSQASGINQAMSRFKSKSRVALTGSPLANNLEELYSLMEWIAPRYLGSRVEFKANYEEPIKQGLWQQSVPALYRNSLKWLEVLKEEIAPKVHRADISVLQGRLREKQEFVIRVPLTTLQTELYDLYVETMHSANTSKTTAIWAIISVLKLLCNHPRCFRSKLLGEGPMNEKTQKYSRPRQNAENAILDEDDAIVDAPVAEVGISPDIVEKLLAPFSRWTEHLDSAFLSNKMRILMDILRYSKEAHDKVLVFSHTLDTLNYVEDQLEKVGMKYSRIDGNVFTTRRQQITKDFNAGDLEVCLISTRSGGQGLNLYGANRVVILDCHYNPMYEEQAVGRSYRIGQQKAVFVYYLMAGGTFEEALHSQSVFKQQLAKRVVDKKNPVRTAMRGYDEYLRPLRDVDQRDLAEFRGKDPQVLDRILATQSRHPSPIAEDSLGSPRGPIIRSMDFTETFHKEDTVTLTAEEKAEASQWQKNEQLRRTDPASYNLLLDRRRSSRYNWTNIQHNARQTLEPFVSASPFPRQELGQSQPAENLLPVSAPRREPSPRVPSASELQNNVEAQSSVSAAQTASSSLLPPNFKAFPVLQNLLDREAAKMAQSTDFL